MPLTDYKPGSKAIFYYAAETSTYPAGVAKPSETLALPTPPVWGGWADVPQIVDDSGSRPIYGLGSREPQTVMPGGHLYSVSVGTRLANVDLLRKCLTGSGGFEDLADLAIWTGVSGLYSDVIRYCKCNSLSFSFQSGSGQELTAQMEFWGLAESTGTVLTPGNTQFGAYGAPLTWHNLMEVNINGVNLRDVVNSVTFNISNALERKEWRPDYGPSSIWSFVPYAIMPGGQISYTVTLGFHSQNAKKRVLNLLASATETGAFELVVSNVGSSTEGSVSNGFTLEGAVGRIGQSTRQGGDTSRELMSQVTLVLTGVTLTPIDLG